MTSRRSFITGLVAFVAAPAIVRAGSLMPVKATEIIKPTVHGYDFARIADYNLSDPIKLDVLYGKINLGDVVRIRMPRDFRVDRVQHPADDYQSFIITDTNQIT